MSEERLVELFLCGCSQIGDVVGDLDVAHGRECWQKIEALEDEADFGTTHFGALGVRKFGEVDAVDQDGAGGGAGETAEDVEEGRLA